MDRSLVGQWVDVWRKAVTGAAAQEGATTNQPHKAKAQRVQSWRTKRKRNRGRLFSFSIWIDCSSSNKNGHHRDLLVTKQCPRVVSERKSCKWVKKITGETPEVRSYKRKPREKKERKREKKDTTRERKRERGEKKREKERKRMKKREKREKEREKGKKREENRPPSL